jgi:subtilisin-like proprotein convertase family protein
VLGAVASDSSRRKALLKVDSVAFVSVAGNGKCTVSSGPSNFRSRFSVAEHMYTAEFPRVRKVRRFFLAVLSFLLPLSGAHAQEFFRLLPDWQGHRWADGRPLPSSFQAISLQAAALSALLDSAPSRFEQPRKAGTELVMPDSEGVWRRYRVWSSPVMAPGLAVRYPEIRTWIGVDAENPACRLILDHGPRGLHAMITCPGAPDQFLDPWDHRDGTGPLIAYSRRAVPLEDRPPFLCQTPPGDPEPGDRQHSAATDDHLRTYRLALACTGEYGTFHGGGIASVLAAMVTTMHRVNGIYERDFGLRMELVDGNDQIIFLNPDTDPFENGNISSMLSANQQLCDQVIGSANYDIGHVFGTAGGGLATLFGPCNANTKARAATGLSNPVGDPFDVDYAAHEIGHQFGANHTFNNSCSGNRNNLTAWEPGSGSTIMAYAGICAPNVQSFSDAYFHGGSQAEVRQFTVNGNGNTCPQLFPSGNGAPQVDAGPDRVIPHSTPFELHAQGWDPDGDTLSYCWEQFNPQIGTMPPAGNNGQGPLFRSLPPSLSPGRVFPPLPSIIQNQSPEWEVLPAVARTLSFRVTARDNHPLHGRWSQDALQLTVSGSAGPFRVTDPDLPLIWTIGDTMAVGWDVAGTDQPPVNSPLVDILLSTDGGYTYPIILGQGLPNQGLAMVVTPYAPGAACRVRVQGHGHIFFDISDSDFSITEPSGPSFLAQGIPDHLSLCRDRSDTASLSIALRSMGGFVGPLALSWTGPAGLESDLPVQYLPDQTDTLHFRVWFGEDQGPDPSPLEVLLAGAGEERRLRFGLDSYASPEQAPLSLAPEDGQDSVSLHPPLVWSAVEGTNRYLLELASSPAFGPNVFEQVETTDTLYRPTPGAGAIVYWRVRAGNPCGYTGPGEIRVFRTLSERCGTYIPSDLPVLIPAGGIFTANSPVTVPDSGRISRVEADIDLEHGNLGQITLRLMGPQGQTRNLVSKACTGLQDIRARFSDDGVPPICSSIPPALSGLVQAQGGTLDLFQGLEATGDWTLRIIDDQFQTGGVLHSWTLHLCRSPELPVFPAWSGDTLDVPYLGEEEVHTVYLSQPGLTHTLRQIPREGQLLRETEPLGTGDRFHAEEVLSGLIRYRHDGGGILEDSLILDVLDTLTQAWRPGWRLAIRIQPDLQASLKQEAPISCAGRDDGVLVVHLEGGRPPLSYRLWPGGDWQIDRFFRELSGGLYFAEARDSNGFSALAGPLELEEPDTLILSGQQSAADAITLSPQGGRPPYRFRLEGEEWQDEAVFTGLSGGSWPFEVMDSSDCRAGVIVEIMTSSLDKTDGGMVRLQVFPNPARDVIHARLDGILSEALAWRLVDVWGRVVRSGSTATGIWTISCGELPAGWYLLHVDSAGGSARLVARLH